ncbi:HU family DNA-binding protein [Pseudosulfitobacter pseudonitzschiae]|uniref:HU family DNA-binding protein n=1 Tax=Pseudosulfitobacter pseudonitzschiae TaxID=1402135 RepID=UPI003B7A2D63
MKKTDFIDAVAEKSGLSKADADKALKAITETICEVAGAKDKISLVGFGTFEGKTRPAREARNPSTGATIQVAEKTILKFKPSASLDL